MANNIITAAPTPVVSLGLKLQVTNGRNQIQRAAGQYAALYLVPGSRIVENNFELAVGETYNSNPGETTSNLILYTSGQLVFSAARVVGGSVSLQVNNLLALDDPLVSYSFTNNSNSAVRVSMNAVNYSSLAPAPSVYYGAAVLPEAYNPAFVQSLAFAVQTSKNQTVNITAGLNEYLYYCYPLIQGQSSFEVNGFVGGMSIVGVVTLNTPQGPLQYYVYQSDNVNLGPTTLTVAGV